MSDALPKWQMNHDEIAARNLVESYVLGKLSPDESARFEEHFVDCPACLEQLEASERFRSGLLPLADERGAPVSTATQNWRAVWAIAAAVMLAVGASLFFALGDVKLRRELQQSRNEAQAWKRRYEEVRPVAPAPLVASTFYLDIVRGGEPAGSAPVNRVTLPAVPGWVVLSLNGELDAGAESVRAEIVDSKGAQVWQQSDLRAVPGSTLSIVLPSGLLHPGDYVVTVQGIGRYRFRVLNPNPESPH